IAGGKVIADSYTVATLRFHTARSSHAFFHQSAAALKKMLDLTPSQAEEITCSCPGCQGLVSNSSSAGANPRGLSPHALWQSDVPHVLDFGRPKYVHVSIDTFSGMICASAP
ncbi:POK11 protein, partial [Chionis minor]|nr:POK11 protein [Chionis minor]